MTMGESAEPNQRRLRYEPALDGMRGFGMLIVLCFHSQFFWAEGGFLAISMFFTLSGYLITSIFLVERERSGHIRLIAFWGRRLRRLMPAALMTLAMMPLFAAAAASPAQLEHLRSDVLWSILYLANWHFLVSDIMYTQLFQAPSPVQHFWSLAIEEQFYLFYPLIIALGLWLASGSRARFGGVLATLTLASIAVSGWLSASNSSVDRMYYGSDTRAAEILIGAIFALWMCGRTIENQRTLRAIKWLGLLAGLITLWAWSAANLESSWLYEGGLAAYSVLTLVVILAAIQNDGPVRAFLSVPLLTWMGRVSYGAYLFHWPIFLWLTPERTGLDNPLLFALRGSLTFGLAGLSYHYLESPILARTMLTRWRPYLAAPVAIAVALIGTSVVVASGNRSRNFDEAQHADVMEFVAEFQAARPEPGNPPNLFEEVPRVAYFGDSTAVRLSVGTGYWMDRNGTARYRLGVPELGCGVARSGVYRVALQERRRPKHCKDRNTAWPRAIRELRPDIAVVLTSLWDIADRKLPGDETWRHIGDPVIDDFLRQEFLSAVDQLISEGTLVIWLTHPAVRSFGPDGVAPKVPFPESDPARMTRLNELIFELETKRPGQVRVIDLAGYMRTLPNGELDPTYRPDGVHLSVEGAVNVARDWLAEELLRVYRDQAAKATASQQLHSDRRSEGIR